MNKQELRELFADLAHKQWSGWMKYLFSKSDSNFTLPQWAVERWQRQMKTEYANLSEEEKNSDRDEADKMMIIAEQYAKSKISILLTETIEPLQSEINRLREENKRLSTIIKTVTKADFSGTIFGFTEVNSVNVEKFIQYEEPLEVKVGDRIWKEDLGGGKFRIHKLAD